jgi:hypothetical protein
MAFNAKAFQSALIGKSKTVNFIALFMAIIAVVESLGYELDPKLVAALGGLITIILRFFTDSALEDKVAEKPPDTPAPSVG